MTTKTTEPNPNMELWNSVWQTPPHITKKVTQRGGFTAICAQAQLKRATELWGPYGRAWGIKASRHDYIKDASGDILEVCFSGTFWYPKGEFDISADMAYKPGNDTAKKLRTDARSKALSTLGFNSDIFEGLYDDNKYVAEMRAKENGNAAPTVPPAIDPKTLAAADDLPWDEPAPAPKAPPVAEPVTEDQLRDIRAHMPVPFGDGTLTEDRLGKTYAAYNVSDVTKLTRRQAANVLLACKKLKEEGQ